MRPGVIAGLADITAEPAVVHADDVTATAHRITSTQAMVAHMRGDTILVSEQSLPTLPVTARTVTHSKATITWRELHDAVLDSTATGRPQTFYLVDDTVDAEGNAWPLAFTANRVRIVPGLRVRDYNYAETTVTDARPHLDGPLGTTRTPWFRTANGGTFDGSRLSALD